jgi:sorbitol-specific phosphotransferase system component IIC
MTVVVTEATRTAISAAGGDTLTSTQGIIAILLVIVLLVLKELVRAVGTQRAKTGADALNIAIVPLFLVFAFIVIVRLGSILHSGAAG